MCLACGRNPLVSTNLCDPCLAYRREKKRRETKERLAAGLCMKCGQTNKLPHNSKCEVCFFKELSNQHFSSVADHEALRKLFHKNGGRCAYSNQPLTLGLNATVDHITPVAKGGSLGIENIQFLHATVNQMKWSFTEEEFLYFVKAIHDHRS